MRKESYAAAELALSGNSVCKIVLSYCKDQLNLRPTVFRLFSTISCSLFNPLYIARKPERRAHLLVYLDSRLNAILGIKDILKEQVPFFSTTIYTSI